MKGYSNTIISQFAIGPPKAHFTDNLLGKSGRGKYSNKKVIETTQPGK